MKPASPATDKTQDLGSGPVMRTLLRMSLPAIGMMLLNTLIFLIDSIFVSWLGEEQMTAMSLSLPIMIAYFAFLEGVGGGTTALVGQHLGQDKRRTARRIALSGLALAYALCIPTFLFLLPAFSRGLFETLGASGNVDVLRHAYVYNFWLPITSPFVAYTYIANCAFRCKGDTVTPLIAMSISNVVNGLLDPLLIFTLGLGIEGAAIATLCGRICSVTYIIRKMRRANELSLPPLLRPRRILLHWWKPIFLIGFPVTLSTGTVALGFGWLNRILASFGHYAVTALAIALRIEDFSFNVIIGVCSALTPFLAFNYGRRDLPRMIAGIRAATIISCVAMFSIGAVLFIFPHPFIALFKPTARAADLSALAIRFAIAAYPFLIAQFILNALFVATGYSLFGTISQLTRSILVRVPIAYLFAHLWGERGIWGFQPASWFCGAAVSAAFAIYLVRHIRNLILLENIKASANPPGE